MNKGKISLSSIILIGLILGGGTLGAIYWNNVLGVPQSYTTRANLPSLTNSIGGTLVYADVAPNTTLIFDVWHFWGFCDGRFLIFDPSGNILSDITIPNATSFNVLAPYGGVYKILATDASMLYDTSLSNSEVGSDGYDWGLVAALRPHHSSFRTYDPLSLKVLVPAGGDFTFHATTRDSGFPGRFQLYDADNTLVADIEIQEDDRQSEEPFETIVDVTSTRAADEFWTVILDQEENENRDWVRPGLGFWLEDIEFSHNIPVHTMVQTYAASTEDAWFNPAVADRKAELTISGSNRMAQGGPGVVYRTGNDHDWYYERTEILRFSTANEWMKWRWRERTPDATPQNDNGDPYHINWTGFQFGSFDARYQDYLSLNISPLITFAWTNDAFVSTHPAFWNEAEKEEFVEFVLAGIIHCVAPDIYGSTRQPYNVTGFHIFGEPNLLLGYAVDDDTALDVYIDILKRVGQRVRNYPDPRVSSVPLFGGGMGTFGLGNLHRVGTWISTIIDEADQYLDLIGWDRYDYFTLEETFRYGEDAIQYRSLLSTHGDMVADERFLMLEFNLRGGPPTAGEYYDTYYESLYTFGAISNGYNHGIWQMNYYSLVDDLGYNHKGLFTSEYSSEYGNIYSQLSPKMRKPVSYAMEVIGNITNPHPTASHDTIPPILNGTINVDQLDYLASVDSEDTLRLAVSNRFEGKTKLDLFLDGIDLNGTIKTWRIEDFSITLLPADFVDVVSKKHLRFDLEPMTIYYLSVNVSSGDNESPTVEIAKPENGIYIFDRKILPNAFPLIIGKITAEVDAYDEDGIIDRVEFCIDAILKNIDNEPPFEWLWDETVIGTHTIKAIAYDFAGNMATVEQEVWIFNL